MAASTEISTLLESVEKIKNYDFKDPVERTRAMIATREASDALQLPIDKVTEMWGASVKDAAIKVCMDVDLFSKWQAVGGVQSGQQLAEMTGVDRQLFSAMLKHLAGWHIIKEEGPDLYSPTQFTSALTDPEVAACVDMHFDFVTPGFSKLPVYLKANGYTRPSDPNWTPLSYAANFHGNLFKYLSNHRDMANALNLSMKGYSQWRGNWLQVFPTEKIIDGADAEQTLVVDIAGSLGHDITRFYRKYPEISENRLVLQDLARVLDDATELPLCIRKMAHDFFKEQPIKNARTYFIQQALHNWADEPAREIIGRIKEAMRPGTGPGSSRLLIADIVLPPTGASLYGTTSDLVMMSINAAKERDESQWIDLIQSTGLKVEKIWRNEAVVNAVIECVLE